MKVNFNLNNYNLKSFQTRVNNSCQTQPLQMKPSFCGDVFVPSKQEENFVCVGKGQVYNKKLKEKVTVNILKQKEKDFLTTYHFVPTNKEKPCGYVTLALIDDPKKFDFWYEGHEKKVLEDYPELGIVGPRVVVDYLKNSDESEYAGIGVLADKIGVKHCLDNGFPPLIISEAAKNSHIAHYKRGKRFLPLESYTSEYKFFMDKYGTADVNAIIKTSIEQSNGEKLDIRDWPNLIMRLSEEKVEQYKKELRK